MRAGPALDHGLGNHGLESLRIRFGRECGGGERRAQGPQLILQIGARPLLPEIRLPLSDPLAQRVDREAPLDLEVHPAGHGQIDPRPLRQLAEIKRADEAPETGQPGGQPLPDTFLPEPLGVEPGAIRGGCRGQETG